MVAVQFCPVISDIPVGIIYCVEVFRLTYLWRLKKIGMISSVPKVGDTGARCLLYALSELSIMRWSKNVHGAMCIAYWLFYVAVLGILGFDR